MSFDTLRGAQYNLLLPQVKQLVRSWLASGVVLGVWLGTPCTSWSIACRPALRDRSNIWGYTEVPAHRLPTLTLGNTTLRFSIVIIKDSLHFEIPCLLENPDSSLMFHAPPLVALLRHPRCTVARLCMCAYGAPWRKATKIVGWHADCSGLNKMCHSRGGKCEFQDRYHAILSGRDPVTGATWTSLAGRYPSKFSRAAVQILAAAANQQYIAAATGVVCKHAGGSRH